MKKNLLTIFSVLFISLFFVFTANAQTDNNSNKDEKKTEKQEKDRPLKIIKRQYPRSRNCEQSSGRITLRVTFDKSAKVTNVEIIKPSDCTGFDDNAIEAARGIKFNPAIKNGESVTVKKLVQYDFRKF